MKKIDISKLKEFFFKKSQIFSVIGLIVFLLASFFNTRTQPSEEKKQSGPVNESPDTIIPKGFVLVPIELKNAESLSALIENFAIVDLYIASLSSKAKGQKVGHHLRLLRAPLNPNTFAVLVPDGEASRLINGNGPLFAVIQNRDQSGHGSMEKNQKKLSHVQYYIGG